MSYHSANVNQYSQHQHYAPPPNNNIANTNLYDTSQADEPSVAVSQSSPVLHNYPSYPNSCIPHSTPCNDSQITRNRMVMSVPNSESRYPNQAPILQTQAQYGGRVPPNQPWARPLAEPAQQTSAPVQAPVPMQSHTQHRRSSSHHSQENYPQNFNRRASIDNRASGYTVNPAGYTNVAQHQSNQHHQQYYQQPATSGFVPAIHVHANPHAHVYSNVPAQQAVMSHNATHAQSYQPVQSYQQTQYQSQHYVESQAGDQNIASEPLGNSTYGMFAPAEHAQQQMLAQNAPYEAYPEDDGLLLNTPLNFNFSSNVGLEEPAAVEHQNHEHVESDEHEHHEHEQVHYHHHQHAEPEEHQFHPHHHQHAVVQPNVNVDAGYGYSAQHVSHSRRNSDFAAPREQTQFQHAAPVAHHPHAQNNYTHQLPQAHSHSRSSSMSEPPTKKLAVAAPNPLLYPDGPTTQEQTQLVSIGDNSNQPKETPARQTARYYQTGLEVQFLGRASAMGQVIGPSYRQDTSSDYEDQSGSSPCPQSSPAQRMQPVVPSQAHERPIPVPVTTANSNALALDKKDQATPKKPALACLFCRKRKIACGPPPPDSPDRTCNQCLRRKQPCEYPTESRRGIRKSAPKEQVKEEEEDEYEEDEYSPTTPPMRFVKHDPNGKPKPKPKGKGKASRKRSHNQVE